MLLISPRARRKTKTGGHSQRSYPVGGFVDDVLAGLQPGDVASDISSRLGKHAWSCFSRRGMRCRRVRGQSAAFRCQGAARDRRPLRRHHAVRAADGVAAVHPGAAGGFQVSLREVCGAGEPLNPK